MGATFPGERRPTTSVTRRDRDGAAPPPRVGSASEGNHTDVEAAHPGSEIRSQARAIADPGDTPEARHRVLVIEDDPSVGELIVLHLERAGFSADLEADGLTGLEAARSRPYDLIVLDLMLPRLDGFELCRSVRAESSVPIVMVTARTAVADVVAGLELGADDYITKPFDTVELVARARAAVRAHAPAPTGAILTRGDLEIHLDGFQVFLAGRPVALTATEFRLLREMAQHPGEVLSRGDLLERVWGYDYLGDSRLVDMAVKRVRDKLGDDPRQPTYLATVRGAGYRFEPAG